MWAVLTYLTAAGVGLGIPLVGGGAACLALFCTFCCCGGVFTCCMDMTGTYRDENPYPRVAPLPPTATSYQLGTQVPQNSDNNDLV